MPFPEFDPVLIHLGPAADPLVRPGLCRRHRAGLVLRRAPGRRPSGCGRRGKPPVTPAAARRPGPVDHPRHHPGRPARLRPLLQAGMYAQLFTGQTWASGWSCSSSGHGGMSLPRRPARRAASPSSCFARRNKHRPAAASATWSRPSRRSACSSAASPTSSTASCGAATTDVPWAIRFCNARIEQTYGVCPAGDVPRHPSQLYEAGAGGPAAVPHPVAGASGSAKLLAKPRLCHRPVPGRLRPVRVALENVRQPDAGHATTSRSA